MNINIDLSNSIKSANLFCPDCGTQEEITNESWAEEKNKGKTLNKPFRTPKGPKKFSVYVKNDKGNIVKVTDSKSDYFLVLKNGAKGWLLSKNLELF